MIVPNGLVGPCTRGYGVWNTLADVRGPVTAEVVSTLRWATTASMRLRACGHCPPEIRAVTTEDTKLSVTTANTARKAEVTDTQRNVTTSSTQRGVTTEKTERLTTVTRTQRNVTTTNTKRRV